MNGIAKGRTEILKDRYCFTWGKKKLAHIIK